MAGLAAVPGVRRKTGNGTLKPVGETASPFSKQERGAAGNGLNPHRFKALHVSLAFTLRLQPAGSEKAFQAPRSRPMLKRLFLEKH